MTNEQEKQLNDIADQLKASGDDNDLALAASIHGLLGAYKMQRSQEMNSHLMLKVVEYLRDINEFKARRN